MEMEVEEHLVDEVSEVWQGEVRGFLVKLLYIVCYCDKNENKSKTETDKIK